MKAYDIVLLTESRYEQPAEIDWYVQNILTEDGLVQRALEERGWRVGRFDWARPDFDWSVTRTALFRTTWDYFHRFAEFSAWLERAGAQTTLINPQALIRWNMDKHYLRDLEQRGVRTIPTVYIEQGESAGLRDLHRQTGWSETILKPAVSGAARHTYRLDPSNLDAHETIFRELTAVEAMMLQPFQQQIVERGEVAMVVVDGVFSHAVLKVAKKGDFRVQDDFGGAIYSYTPSAEEIAFAEEAVAACEPAPLYARVDLVTDNEGRLAVVELELIEPELWFRQHPPAAMALAEAIERVYLT